jgi:aspartyl-tRNA(Asn)/glutamyl-tRNA(Gln) amidotransferase subunit B
MSATVDAPVLAKYEMVVGLEVHVQLRTRTKLFCNCSTQFGDPPNRNTCPVCLALPGSLPVLNESAVELATRAALALDASVQEESVFARKNYFYPDLPKGYQISQFDKPLALDGRLVIGEQHDGSPMRVRITRVHMEEDAGKSIHDRYPAASAIDLNRAGTPLIEIVSEPDIRSSAEAGSYLRLLKQLLEYVDVSDLNMEEGSLRVDANISIRERGATKLGTKTEVKNMNSFSGVERALDAEFARQVAIVESQGRVEQETLLWDADRGTVRPARSKEGSHDYRYFPDPDLPPLRLTKEWIAGIRDRLPELPDARRRRFATEHKLNPYDVDVLTASPHIAEYFEAVAHAHGDSKTAANWVMGEVLAVLKNTGVPIDRFSVRPADLATLLDMVRGGAVSNSAAKRIFALMVQTGDRPEQIAEREGLAQVGDEAQVAAWVDEVIADKPAEWQRYLAGEKKLLGVFVGAVMKRSGGRADPRKVNQLLSTRASG